MIAPKFSGEIPAQDYQSLPTAGEKICRHCAQVLPVEQFRRLGRDSQQRHSTCNRCHAAAERARVRRKRQFESGWNLQKSCSGIARSNSLARAQSLLELMVAGFGGPGRFAAGWAQEIDRLRSSRRPSTRLTRMYEAVVKLTYLADLARRDIMNTATPEELEEAMWPVLLKMIRLHPRIAVEAAEEIGATIIWPGSAAQGRSPSQGI